MDKRIAKNCLLAVLVVLLCGLRPPGAESKFGAIVKLWETERYQEAFDELLRYRETESGKNEVVYYMIATSACRIGQPQLGLRLLESILYTYKLEPASLTLVNKELDRCPPVRRLHS